MTCPKCQAEFEKPFGTGGAGGSHSVCPVCGVRLLRSVTGVVRTSAVMISAGDEDSFYNSLQEVPEPLRTQLMQSTNSDNSGTIVIADRAGKEQLTHVLARRENKRAKLTRRAAGAAFAPAIAVVHRRSWIPWLVCLMILVAAGLISAWLGLRW